MASSHGFDTFRGVETITDGCRGVTGDEINNCCRAEYLNEVQSIVDTQATLMESLFTPHTSPGTGVAAASIAIVATSVFTEAHLHCAEDAD